MQCNFKLYMGKVNKIVSIQNLAPEVLELLVKKYPDGYQNHVIKVNTHGDNFFYGVTLDTSDVSYLIKVPVKIDTNPEEFEEQGFGSDEDTIAGADEFADSTDDDDKDDEVKNVPADEGDDDED